MTRLRAAVRAVVARRRRRTATFDPRRLFINGEAGAWYDPGDLTAEKVAWRRNLLTWSEQFDNAAWTKLASTITANADVAPDGTTTADKIVETATTASHGIFQNVTVMAGAPYTFSVYAKAAERGFCQVRYENSGSTQAFSANVNLSTGTFTTTSFGTPTGTAVVVTNVGSGWYRIALTTNAGDTTFRCAVFLQAVQGTNSYAGDGTSGALAWGSMLNPGTVAESYQRITDFTSDFLAAFPTHALYQDAAGTTPVTALGQPVGLALDKSRGGLANLGPSRIANGAVGLTGTATAATYNTTTGAGTAVRVDPSNQSFVQFSGLTANALCLITVQNTGANSLTVRTGVDSGAIFATVAAGAATRMIGQASAGGQIAIVPSTGTIAFTVLGFNEVPGVHAIQATSASRPALDARVNLLTRTEEFNDAVWTKDAGGTGSVPVVTPNVGVAPDGTNTADRVVFAINGGTTAADFSQMRQQPTIASASYKVSVWMRTEDNSTKVVSFVGAQGVAIAETITGTWREVTTTGIGTGAWRLRLRGGEGTADSATLLVWGADFRLATDAAYPYQRVVTATDYADVGVPRSFLHDGFDDSSYTASSLDLSGTDKVTVWAGVYKNSDAAAPMIYEHTADSNTNNGAMFMLANTNGRYQVASKGTVITTAQTAGGSYPVPISNVLTLSADIGADVLALRVNGTQAATSSADQGTGNYANAVSYFGRRGNASLPFNGKIYTIIIRGGVTDAATLALTERYVGSRMGIVL